jgi:hypothetical protein
MLHFMEFSRGWMLVGMVGCVGAQVAACAETTSGAKHPVRARAPFDLHCSAEDLAFERFDAKTIGVSGCGRRATYVEHCRDTIDAAGTYITGLPMTDTECQWIMNSSSRD